MENMNYILTPDVAAAICEHYGQDINTLETWEIMELVDKALDEFLCKC